MERLAALLKRFGRRPGSRAWSGPRPPLKDRPAAAAIAAQVGYPTAASDPLVNGQMIPVDRAKAASILAYVASRSLAYEPFRTASEGVRMSVLDALADLSPTARFFTNGDWGAGSPSTTWQPLSTATFDAGVLGFDDDNAFIYWREEED